MSKRHGATSVEQYRNLGYLPEAIVNFLALLGWSPEGEEEIFSRDELIKQFSLDRVAKNPAVFDVDKLNWLSGHYLRQAGPRVMTELALPHLAAAGHVTLPLADEKLAWLEQAVAVVQEHVDYAAQAVEHLAVFFNDDVAFESDEARDILRDPDIPAVMAAFRERLSALPVLDAAAVQGVLKGILKDLKLGGKKVYMPVRVAITGQVHGPDLIRLIVLLGRERVLARMAGTLAAV
jgi:nondiscriminating glutamyl-tRNA synthetase